MAQNEPFLGFLGDKVSPTSRVLFLRQLVQIPHRSLLKRWMELGNTRMYLLLHLLYLHLTWPHVLTFILSHPVETNVRPIKNTFWCIKYAGYAYRSDWDTKPDLFTDSNMLLVDLAGVEPASRAPYF